MTGGKQRISPDRSVLEICVDNAEGLFSAIEGGADRIELCSALSVGGLTPSRGFMELAGRQAIPVYAMIRPRPGDFVFSPEEIAIMKADIDAARGAGLAGVVLGATSVDSSLDVATLRSLCRHAAGLDLTLHRAFDVVSDMEEALEIAVALGFSRILTSGGCATALEGIERLARLVERAGSRISIMPGAGVRAESAERLLARLPVHELHASCSSRFTVDDGHLVELNFAAREMLKTDAGLVRTLKAILLSHVRERSQPGVS